MKTYYNKNFILSKPEKFGLKYIAKRILLLFLDFFYKTLLLLLNKKNTPKKYYLSVCTIFKNESAYLKEWLEYHLLVGVEHFYLYNNFSEDNYKEILSPYIDSGVVDLIDWPVPQGQPSAYEDCFNKTRTLTNWILFIDIDEYVVPRYELTISDWLKHYEFYPSVAMYWRVFGTSAIVEEDKTKLIAEQYIVCWDKLDSVTKVAFNTRFDVSDFKSHHFMSAKIKNLVIPPVNESRKFIKFNIHRVKFFNHESTIQINHYWSKSYNDYRKRKSTNGDVFYKVAPYDQQYFVYHEHKNTSVDYTIWRFIIELKMKLGKI